MNARSWLQKAGAISRHDLVLVALVFGMVAVSASVLAAAVRERVPAVPATAEAAPPVPWESDLATAEVPPEIADLAAHGPDGRMLHGQIQPGDTLGQALGRFDVSHRVVHVIDRGLRPLFDFRRSRPGHSFWLKRDDAGALVEFRYEVSDLESFVLRRDGDGYKAVHEEAELRPQPVRIAGVVNSSLHEAIVQLGEQGQLANDFSEIFAWEFDFTRAVRFGDEFKILYERLYRTDPSGKEVYVRPGRILAARYKGASHDLAAVYFEIEEGRGGYYRPDGSSVEGQFLRAPLRYTSITSRYTSARRHPILKVTRPHHGIDYAAPKGTPVWSVSDGSVIYRGWAGGFGNLVKVRHSNGYISYYSHLSRFAKDLAVGQQVHQKQILGYVGSTGLATGPHVCFRVAKDGKFVNPSRVPTPAGPPVPSDVLARFTSKRQVLMAELDQGPLVSAQGAL
ncbi:MAG: peptidoglycan DD-metalloendopeptidase family protein [Myxococcota bacterium]|nr:peptidoglycan DD-metalloendopeptidase family protein [Myxococcota bacterium]